MTRSGERGFLTTHDRQTLREANSGRELETIADKETLKRIRSRTKQALADFAFLQQHLPEGQSAFTFDDAFSEEQQRLPYDDDVFDQDVLVNALSFILEGIAIVAGPNQAEDHITSALRQVYTSGFSHLVLGNVRVEVESEHWTDALQRAHETLVQTSGDVNALSTVELRALLAWSGEASTESEMTNDDSELLESTSGLEHGISLAEIPTERRSETELLEYLRQSPALLEEDLEVAIAEPAGHGEMPIPDIICSKDDRPILIEVKFADEDEHHRMIEQAHEMLEVYSEPFSDVELLLVVPDAAALPFDLLDKSIRVFEVEFTVEGEQPFTFSEIETKEA